METEPYKVWLVVVLFCIPYLLSLGVSSLWDINEAFYAEAPREMLAAGDLVTPRFNFQFRFEKPILSYWVLLLAYLTMGVGEFSARLPIALLAVGTIITTYLLGRLLFGRTSGFYSALILATSLRIFLLARRSIIDLLLLFFITGALFSIVKSLESDKHDRLYAYLFYVALALGTLTKGLIALIIPVAIVGLYLFLTRRTHLLYKLRISQGLVIYLLVTAPWFIIMFLRHGWPYLDFFFLGQHASRYLHASYSVARPIGFYLPILFAGFFPWSLFLIPALVHAFKSARANGLEWKSEYMFIIVWFGFVLLFFSFSKGKQEQYIDDLYPPCALILGNYFHWIREASSNVHRLIFSILSALAGAAFIAVSLFYFGIANRLFGFGDWKTLIPGIVLGAVAGLLLAAAIMKMKTAVFTVISTGLFIFLLCTPPLLLPKLEAYKPVRPFSDTIKHLRETDDLVGCYNVSLPSLCFYVEQRIFESYNSVELSTLFHSGKRVFCIMHEEDYQTLVKTTDCKLTILDRRPELPTTGKSLLSLWREGHIDNLVLVSNKS